MYDEKMFVKCIKIADNLLENNFDHVGK